MQEGAEGGTMLVYPQRRPSAMRFHCFQSKQLQRHFHFCLILVLRQSDWKTQPHRLWLSLAFFFLMLLVSGNSPWEEKQRKKRVSHFMVTKYIQLELKSAYQTPGHFCKRPQHSEDFEGGPFRLQQVRGAAGRTGFSQNEFSSSD